MRGLTCDERQIQRLGYFKKGYGLNPRILHGHDCAGQIVQYPFSRRRLQSKKEDIKLKADLVLKVWDRSALKIQHRQKDSAAGRIKIIVHTKSSKVLYYVY